MDQINPFAGSILQSTQVQHQQSADKSRQIRRHQTLGKNVAAPTDEFEHTVESIEALAPIHEEGSQDHPQRKRPKQTPQAPQEENATDDQDPHLDLTA